jgi:hypothetical protein
VIGNGSAEFKDVVTGARPGQKVIDLVRIGADAAAGGGYEGICW